MTPENLARLFHETYERLAPEHGYETRKASAVPWADVPDSNKALMVDVAAHILATVLPVHEAAIAELKATVARVKALAEDMRTWCSPHGIAVTYANSIDEAIEPPEQDHDALMIGSDSEAEFAAKLGAIMREHRAEVHLEHHEGCGNCAVIKGAPEILTAGLYRSDLPAVRAFAAEHDPRGVERPPTIKELLDHAAELDRLRREPPCPTT